MEYFEIDGGRKLFGSVRLSGAKNAVLPLLAASLLTDEKVVFHDCPRIADVDIMIDLIRSLGVKCYRDDRTVIKEGSVSEPVISKYYAAKMRASIFLLAPLLAKCKRVVTSYPGGCDIGNRKINLHIENLKKMGASFVEKGCSISGRAQRLYGKDLALSFPSVGATETLVMASVLADGVTIIENVAREPEIDDLVDFLNSLGAKIFKLNESTLKIEGVKSLKGGVWTPVPDRIVGGTLMAFLASCGGELEISNFPERLSHGFTSLLACDTCEITERYNVVKMEGLGQPVSFGNLVTSPYPGFATDMQAQILAVSCVADGRTAVEESIFENRFLIAPELAKMGADIVVTGREAVVNGVESLSGADVFAKDLRGGAGLCIAACQAAGKSRVYGVDFIDRGYENLDETLFSLGVRIKRKRTED